ncbi:glycine betaine/L-proline ABC transporter ATP-binding protein [Pseudovibrio sp. Tun.PSC04-5.I4]|uniref:quaternary amine ABC transporter ATP-binding protein n=1 Tax=Pseudovibrio sp. Tun.PSC04-5.I4 TaxID=1798213 RepID=UPI00088C30FD|nr:glycine betaine/L-proline ABC transporter ATP-binding protein [Pseudovibrio sp. Tun.PSC04-5.I4]SDR28409.1 glycine betaine/proline transport system ATP-binding protein [Pseudovibrio sp. Tun.PSC04-5.I4]
MALIEVKNITKIFGRAPHKELAKVKNGMGKDQLLAETNHTLGLHDVSLSIEKGEIFVIMGLSGSGKSTLIRHFNRLIDPTDGQILVDGEDVIGLSEKELETFRRNRMSMVFQRFGLMPHRTVVQNVAYGLEVQGIVKADREKTAREWIDTVGLSGFENQYPSQLSGGMQQRVGLARALATDADILLMDEAFSALDPLIRSQMQDQLVELQEKLHKTIVFITHDLDEALRIGDKIAILKDGVLSQVGTPSEILLEPADDYVRAFVRDVNRARVLTVDTVMQPPALRITHDNMEKALADMRRHDEDFGYVVENKEYRGVVSQESLAEEVAKPGDSPSLYAFADDSSAVELECTLEAALPTTLEADYPVAVVDEDGHFKGILNPEEMGSVLTPPEENFDMGSKETVEDDEKVERPFLKEAS